MNLQPVATLFALIGMPLPEYAIAAADLTADEIVAKAEAVDRARRESMPGYSSIRNYLVENGRFGVKASMKVEALVDARGGAKRFRIVEVSGPAAVRKLVFKRMLDTEAKAPAPDVQTATRISRENYTFRLVAGEVVNGKQCHVLAAEPKSANPMLLRGQIWVDAATFAIVKIEGATAKKLSFWVKSTRFVHQYGDAGGHWAALENRSESEIRIFGRGIVTIR